MFHVTSNININPVCTWGILEMLHAKAVPLFKFKTFFISNYELYYKIKLTFLSTVFANFSEILGFAALINLITQTMYTQTRDRRLYLHVHTYEVELE